MQPTAIVIQYEETPTCKAAAELLALGIEEEGLPSLLVPCREPNAGVCAEKASSTSGLDLGIGLCASGHLLVHRGPNLSLFSAVFSEVDLRAYGANAARLIKRVPLKSVEKAR